MASFETLAWHAYSVLARNDKYSKKVFKYFVEYADKESKKKTLTELERTTTTGEAGLCH